MSQHPIYLGIDSGATTCKVNGIDDSSQPIDKTLRQYPTPSQNGVGAVLDGWIQAAETFLQDTRYAWEDVAGIGLAMPGPFEKRGVLGKLLNYPDTFTGWHFEDDFSKALADKTGREIPVTSANDGHLAGLAEATLIQAEQPGSVFLLAPGSGLGSAFVDASGTMLEGDHISAAFFCCMPLPYEQLGLPKFTTGDRDWASAEAYTALSGLGDLIEHVLQKYEDHKLANPALSKRDKALALRGLAKEDDPLALEVFDLQAKAMGYAVAMASMAYDPSHIVIGGGLIDPDATTEAFRKRYLDIIHDTAVPLLWVEERQLKYHVARLGELSQAIGAALLAKSKTTQL